MPYLVIVGDGEARAALERQARGNGFEGRQVLRIPQSVGAAAILRSGSVFVLPSRHEPWGLIVNEVMNASRPVIVSDDVGAIPI